jgi:hypothetical protein
MLRGRNRMSGDYHGREGLMALADHSLERDGQPHAYNTVHVYHLRDGKLAEMLGNVPPTRWPSPPPGRRSSEAPELSIRTRWLRRQGEGRGRPRRQLQASHVRMPMG